MFNLGEYKATDSTVRFPFGIDFYLHILIDAEHLYDKRFGTRVPFIQFLHLILNSLCEAEEVLYMIIHSLSSFVLLFLLEYGNIYPRNFMLHLLVQCISSSRRIYPKSFPGTGTGNRQNQCGWHNASSGQAICRQKSY